MKRELQYTKQIAPIELMEKHQHASAPRCDGKSSTRRLSARSQWLLSSDGWQIEPSISAVDALAELQAGAYRIL